VGIEPAGIGIESPCATATRVVGGTASGFVNSMWNPAVDVPAWVIATPVGAFSGTELLCAIHPVNAGKLKESQPSYITSRHRP